MRHARLIPVLFAAASLGCGGSTSLKTIGPQGGTVAYGTGASVTVPAGALTSNVPITITPTTGTAPFSTKVVGAFYVFGPEGTQFSSPVTISIAFNDAILPAGDSSSDVVIYTAPAGTTTYTPLATTVTGIDHVQATTTHFSIFVAAANIPDLPDIGVPDDLLGTDAGSRDL